MSLIKSNSFTLLVLFFLTLSVFWQLPLFDFINIDDHAYVIENELIHTGITFQSIKSSFSDIKCGYWIPLTWISFLVDYEFFKLDPGGYHLTNLILHVANTILLFLFLKQITLTHWRSFFVSAFFAVHPMHIESVAWITERKDVLYGLFWILTLMAYNVYVKKPNILTYLLVFFLFSLGLMSKPMMVTLPFVLLLIDFWPLHRCQNKTSTGNKYHIYHRKILFLFFEKMPFLALSIFISIITWITQSHSGAITSIEKYPIAVRISNAMISYIIYIKKVFFPYPLAVFYPHPGNDISSISAILAGFMMFCITATALKSAFEKPYIAFGWFWFIGTIFPVIGITQSGDQGMADRFTYIPYIGLFIILAWGTHDVIKKWQHFKIIILLISFYMTALSIYSAHDVQYWKNAVSITERAVSITYNNVFAHNSAGMAHRTAGQFEDAIKHFKAVLSIHPNDINAINNLGQTLALQGKYIDAINIFKRALSIKYQDSETHSNIGITFARIGKFKEAVHHFKESIKINPNDHNTRLYLRNALEDLDNTMKKSPY